MAGHIDHGKTTLTKALTGVETDRLKEEQERQISIEPGFAPLVQTESIQISIIDVPGHERFIRQMIAGVAGVDLVVLVVAADEGVMPQTREHLHILSLLGIERGIIAITKRDEVDEELLQIVKDDIQSVTKETFLKNAPMHVVDSVSGRGIELLKQAIIDFVQAGEKRFSFHSFRLPIDHVFTVKGQGVIVRGTVFDGEVHLGDELIVLPSERRVRVRQIQSHHEKRDVVFAGQRAALNLSGIAHKELKRGDVLVKDNFYTPTSRIDILFNPLRSISHKIRQRQLIKLYVGTSEVTGKIIFYDRNEYLAGEAKEVLCQLQLDEEVVVTRGDRFILRRATPVETIGGGWVMNPNGKRRRFGKASVEQLRRIKEGTAEERVLELLRNYYAETKERIIQLASVSEEEFKAMERTLVSIGKQMYSKRAVITELSLVIKSLLTNYHENYPLRVGMNKAELVSALRETYPDQLIDYTLPTLSEGDEVADIRIDEQMVALASFTPNFPRGWEKRIEQLIIEWKSDGANVEKMETYFARHQIDQSLQTDLYYYLLHTEEAYEFDEGRLIARNVVEKLREQLYTETNGNSFTLQVARDIVGLSRKNLVPLLELFDHLYFTERNDTERVWLSHSLENTK